MALSGGNCSQSLADRHPGNIRHARWLTTRNHILRTYIGTKKPTKAFLMLATYIVKVYAPVWFAIKTKPHCIRSPAHLFKLVSLSRALDVKVRNIIDPIIQRNAFFAHPENLLLGMLADNRPKIRNLAVKRILDCRKSRLTTGRVRKFFVPELKFSAKSYEDLIDWKNIKTELPLTRSFSEEKLRSIAKSNEICEEFKLPCHTQAVERHVKVNV